MTLPKIRLCKEKAGVISEDVCYCCWLDHGMCWLYTGNSYFDVLWQLVTEWKHDRHLVG
jgi:hypothetical protein